MTPLRKKLIEVALPLAAINFEAAREKSIRHGHPSTLHLWWARRPLAAARAVLFAQLVDDPSSWPDLFPTVEAQDQERQRLFRVIEQLVKWENRGDNTVLNAARLEIARSWARVHPSEKASRVLAPDVLPKAVDEYLATELPVVHDPFAGGGSIPLEAQRLGLRAVATDLNPVAVLINKALIELPPRFVDRPPVNPESSKSRKLTTWTGAQGLADDVRYYGRWMREAALERIGSLYPEVTLPKDSVAKRATVIAWIWARTVTCPNPGCHARTPLVKSFQLCQGREPRWAKPNVSGRVVTFTVTPGESSLEGTVNRRGARCLSCKNPIALDYVRDEAAAGRLDAQMMAIVAEGDRRRLYLSPDAPSLEAAAAARGVEHWEPQTNLPKEALGFRVQRYGMKTHAALFSPRQAVALGTFSKLVGEVADQITARTGDEEYARAVATYLAFSVDKAANYWSSLCSWYVGKEIMVSTFGLPTLSMVWDFTEANPFSDSSGNWMLGVEQAAQVLENLCITGPVGNARQANATSESTYQHGFVCQTDPPYYDNIGYANLADFFYVWLRHSIGPQWKDLLSTVLTPKLDELIAEPARCDGDKERASREFEERLAGTFTLLGARADDSTPLVIYYAFKQQESATSSDSDGPGVVSSGWETMLSSLVRTGFVIEGTWPIRTEQTGGLREAGRNALASSVVLVCRQRSPGASASTRGQFRAELRRGLPEALRALKRAHLAPVDLEQASIGPGMAIFSRHGKVIEADGSVMSVRSALQLIVEALDEYLTAQEGEADADTRFAITWFETHGWKPGAYGEAETLAKARNVSVAGIAQGGIVHSAAGKVRLLKREELPESWDPSRDERLSIWEATQHLIKRLETQGEGAAADLFRALGATAQHARDLAYRLYRTCDRKGWADDAGAYNGLVIAWPEIEKLASGRVAAPEQLGLGIDTPATPTRKPRRKSPTS